MLTLPPPWIISNETNLPRWNESIVSRQGIIGLTWKLSLKVNILSNKDEQKDFENIKTPDFLKSVAQP